MSEQRRFLLMMFAAAALAAPLAYALGGSEELARAAVAISTSLLLGACCLGICQRAFNCDRARESNRVAGAILACSGLRMAGAVLVAAIAYQTADAFREKSFGLWLIGAYIGSLTIETILLEKKLRGIVPVAAGSKD